ncbi:myrosinase 1-like [Anticarsia gemmatalis]|uniref:myrosinase 1-like n=1 Tax=Anticarsia gemmatalis TaxID=129554 RepID=UPI003F75CAF4
MRVVLVCLLNLLIGSDGWTDTKIRKFPKQFMFGAASAAYQVEGAWDADGKGESIWDRFVHDSPEIVVDGINGDVASDSYHLWRRDVEMLRELGVDFYRFSISWPRVLPNGYPTSINEAGFAYYDSLIEELITHGIHPMVTLYHFDLPQYLQDLGGWTNPLSSQWFEDYARVVFDRYADKVKLWITVNQPNTICIDGYGSNAMAPGLNLKSKEAYECVKNVLLGHAKAYRLYEKVYKKKHDGNVGISLALNWFDPFDNSTINAEAVERAREFEIGMYMRPIFSKTGDFPTLVKTTVAKKSQEQGFTTSKLPTLTPEEITLIKGSADFLGMNHYTTFLVKASNKQHMTPSYAADLHADYSQGAQWKPAKSPWLKSAPYGLYKVCIYLNKEYDYPTMIITEHGWSTAAGLGDQSRADNIRQYLSALLLAMEDGTEMRGYTAWSLMDNIEWTAGTSERFGLYQVDFDSPTKERTARLSALVYKNIIETREVDPQWEPSSLNIKITSKNVKAEL